MDLTVWSEKDSLFLKICGEVDHHAVKDTRREVDELILRNKPHNLVMDLSDIEFMDSSGLGFILGRFRRMNDIGGGVVILNPEKRVLDMLKMAGADKLLRIIERKHDYTADQKEGGSL